MNINNKESKKYDSLWEISNMHVLPYQYSKKDVKTQFQDNDTTQTCTSLGLGLQEYSEECVAVLKAQHQSRKKQTSIILQSKNTKQEFNDDINYLQKQDINSKQIPYSMEKMSFQDIQSNEEILLNSKDTNFSYNAIKSQQFDAKSSLIKEKDLYFLSPEVKQSQQEEQKDIFPFDYTEPTQNISKLEVRIIAWLESNDIKWVKPSTKEDFFQYRRSQVFLNLRSSSSSDFENEDEDQNMISFSKRRHKKSLKLNTQKFISNEDIGCKYMKRNSHDLNINNSDNNNSNQL